MRATAAADAVGVMPVGDEDEEHDEDDEEADEEQEIPLAGCDAFDGEWNESTTTGSTCADGVGVSLLVGKAESG